MDWLARVGTRKKPEGETVEFGKLARKPVLGNGKKRLTES